MSCWIMPSHFGSGYFPDPGGSSLPCRSLRCSTYAPAPLVPLSSLFHSAKRIDRSVRTSGMLNTRASSITSAVPDPSSFAASPQPWPSMCALTMYISLGRDVPTFVQYTSSRGPGVVGSSLSFRRASFGCFKGSVLTLVRLRTPRGRPPPSIRGTALGSGAGRGAVDGGGGLNVYFRRSVGQP